MKYILGFLLTSSIFLSLIACLVNFTVLQKNYVYKAMDNNNYYELVYNTINENLEAGNMSSGFDDEILKDLFTKDKVKEDINNTINSIYNNESISIDVDSIKNKLNDNINNYIKNNKIKVYDEVSLNEHIDVLIKIYTDEIGYYSMFNNYIGKFNKLSHIVKSGLIVLIIMDIVLFITIRFILKEKLLGSCIIASGLFMLFIYYHTIVNIDFNTMTLVSMNFTIILRYMVNNILNIYKIMMVSSIIIGLILAIFTKANILKKKC